MFRLFPYGKSAEAFRQMYSCGMLGDLLPELARFIDGDGGERSSTFDYLRVLDGYEEMMSGRDLEATTSASRACFW